MGEIPGPNEGNARPDPDVQGVDLTPHPMVERILDDSGEPREAIVAVGFLGAADDNGLVRIYLDLSFRAYLELPVEQVLYVEKFNPADETQPTKIVVATDAAVKVVQTVESSFIQGSIVTAHPLTTPAATGDLGSGPGRSPEMAGLGVFPRLD